MERCPRFPPRPALGVAISMTLVTVACAPSPAAPVVVTLAPRDPAVETAPAPPTPAPPAPPPTAAPVAELPRSCVPLPPSRPADMVFRYQRSMMPHGGPRLSEAVEIHGAGTACPAVQGPRTRPVLPCRQVSEASLDAIFQAFARKRFTSMHAGPPRSSSPHYPSRYVEVRWGDHTCAVADDISTSPSGNEMADFDALCVALTNAQP